MITQNKSILDLLSNDDREGVLKYFFPADAAMSLLSGLLKRLIVAESIGIPFSQVLVSRHPDHGKPCYAPPPTLNRSVSFNVSHQAGILALIAISQDSETEKYDVGIDVVCPNERGELEKILRSVKKRDAFDEFVEMHSEVFSPNEIEALKMPNTECEEVGWLEEEIERRLRGFYALWCLREAFVKMTGEALLAEWLQELEFREYPVPHQVADGWEETELGNPHQEDDRKGFEAWLKRERVENVEMRIMGVGSKYMVARAIRRKDGKPVDVVWEKMEEVIVEDVVRRCKEAL